MGVICTGLAVAVIPTAILGAVILKSELNAKKEYDSLPGKAQIDANLDRYFFVIFA